MRAEKSEQGNNAVGSELQKTNNNKKAICRRADEDTAVGNWKTQQLGKTQDRKLLPSPWSVIKDPAKSAGSPAKQHIHVTGNRKAESVKYPTDWRANWYKRLKS